MPQITSIKMLEDLYGAPAPTSVTKVTPVITPLYKTWIEASRFVVVSTVGPEGTDGSPRGDDAAVVRIVDKRTLHLPDWMGNNRLDSLRNIILDGRISLMFMIADCPNVVRVNGTAIISADPEVLAHFDKAGKQPETVVVISVAEVYFQCAKALMRSKLWKPEDNDIKLPTAGDFIKEFDDNFDGDTYDKGYPEYAKGRFW